jgi:hypothetical protein
MATKQEQHDGVRTALDSFVGAHGLFIERGTKVRASKIATGHFGPEGLWSTPDADDAEVAAQSAAFASSTERHYVEPQPPQRPMVRAIKSFDNIGGIPVVAGEQYVATHQTVLDNPEAFVPVE